MKTEILNRNLNGYNQEYITYILERDLFNADATEREVEWLVHALNVAGKILIANVMVQHTRMERQIKSDLMIVYHNNFIIIKYCMHTETVSLLAID